MIYSQAIFECDFCDTVMIMDKEEIRVDQEITPKLPEGWHLVFMKVDFSGGSYKISCRSHSQFVAVELRKEVPV